MRNIFNASKILSQTQRKNKQINFLLPTFSFIILRKQDFQITAVYLNLCNDESNSDKRIVKNLKNNFSWLKNSSKTYKLGLGGAVLYENIVDRLNYGYFYKEYAMEDTLFSWFLVTEVHVWMVMLRVMQEGEDGFKLRNYLVEAMWNDVNIRAKKLGNINASLLKVQLELLSEQFNASVIGYDEAITSKDTLLCGHLWRRFFKCEVIDTEQLEKFVYYLRKQVSILSDTPTSKFLSLYPNINWIYTNANK